MSEIPHDDVLSLYRLWGDLGNLHHQFIFSKEEFLFAIIFSTGNEC